MMCFSVDIHVEMKHLARRLEKPGDLGVRGLKTVRLGSYKAVTISPRGIIDVEGVQS